MRMMIAGLAALCVCVAMVRAKEEKVYGNCKVITFSQDDWDSVETYKGNLLRLICSDGGGLNELRVTCAVIDSKPRNAVAIGFWTGVENREDLRKEPVGFRYDTEMTFWMVGHKRKLYTELLITDAEEVKLITLAMQANSTIGFRTDEQLVTFLMDSKAKRAVEEFQNKCGAVRSRLL